MVGGMDAPLLLEVVDWDSNGTNDLIGRQLTRFLSFLFSCSCSLFFVFFLHPSFSLRSFSPPSFLFPYNYHLFSFLYYKNSLNELKTVRDAILLDPKKKNSFRYKNSGTLTVCFCFKFYILCFCHYSHS